MKWISNKTLFNIHGWLGLNLGLLLFVICFSGTFATLSGEVDWLLNGDMRVEKKDAPVQWEAMHQSLQQSYPEGEMLGIYKRSYAGHGDHFASTAYVALPNAQTRKVYLNPYSGQIKGDTSFFNVQRFFRSYHRRFFDDNRGILIITLSSFFLLFSALTGFLFYKGWLKNLFKLRFKKGLKTLFSDAHKLVGIWSLLFTLLIALTGVFYFAELMIQAADNYEALVPDEPAKIEQTELAQFGPKPELLSLDEYVVNAKEAFPGIEISTIRLPSQPDRYVYIDGRAGNILTRNRANKVYLHPFTGEIAHIQRSSELNTAEFITDMADPLHFGYFGGLTTKIIWFIFGLALSFAILSGTYLWYIRGIQKMKRKLRRRGPPSDKKSVKKDKMAISGFFSRHLTLSRGAVISTTIILLYLVTTGIGTVRDGIRSYGPLPDKRLATIEEMELGSWDVALQCEYPCTMKEGTMFKADFQSSGIPNYETLSLEMISEKGDSLRIPFEGSAAKPSLTLPKEVKNWESGELQLLVQSLSVEKIASAVNIDSLSKAETFMAGRFNSYPERSYPDVPTSVHLFISFFGLLVVGILGVWTYFLVKATARKQKLL
jgi:uncharacterized iron-regulated membrane protein